jgi:hypothetical protein
VRVTKISLRYGRTCNLGNFESVKVECEIEAELEEGDDQVAIRKTLHEQVKADVREQLLPLARVRMEQVAEIIQGLPADLQAAVKASLNEEKRK